MVAYLHDDALDNGLAEIDDNVTVLHILSQAVTVYGDVATYSLGNKTPPVIGVPEAGDVSGRKIVVSAITDGSVTGTGTASHYALVSGSKLYVCQELDTPQGVTSGNTFSLEAFDIEYPDPAAGFLHDDVLDDGVQAIDTNVTKLHITSQAVTNFADAETYSLGYKTTPTIGVPEDGDASGRKVVISAITDGVVDGTGTASHWALVSADKLYACYTLTSSQGVTSGNTFSLTEFDITIPDPVA